MKKWHCRLFIYFCNLHFSDISSHTTYIVTGWDISPSVSWITVLANEELVTLDFHLSSTYHGKGWKIASMESKSGDAECSGHGGGLLFDSWWGAERNKTYSGFGSPTIGPRVLSSAPSPEERLDLETVVCPRGRSHSTSYWPGTASDWMPSMSLIRYSSLKIHVCWYIRKNSFQNHFMWTCFSCIVLL